MSENIGKLTTPNNDGANIEVKEDDTIFFGGYTNRLNFNTHNIQSTDQPFKCLNIRANTDIPKLEHVGSEIMLFTTDSEYDSGSIILRTYTSYDPPIYKDFRLYPNGRAVWNNEPISQLSMPSNKSEVLELLSSEGTYTAPADGWLKVYIKSTNAPDTMTTYVILTNQSTMFSERDSNYHESPNVSLSLIAICYAKKGEKITLQYRIGNTIQDSHVRFIYSTLDSIITE